MSDNQNSMFPEDIEKEASNNSVQNDAEDIFASSTVFAAPTEHKDKRKSSRFTLLKKIVAVLLVVAILVGSTVLVVKLIPEKQQEKADVFEPQQIISLDAASFEKITITHPGATLVLNSSVEEKDGQSKKVWTLEGYDETLIDSISLSQIASYAASVTAYGEYDYDKTKAAQYGFDDEAVVIAVETTNQDIDSFTLTVGDETVNGQYNYFHISTAEDKVYLVKHGIVTGFMVEPLDLAISSAIPAIAKTNKNKAYFDEEDLLSDFDTLTLSGAKFKNPIVFKTNKDEKFSAYANYICVSPKMRIADGVVEDIRNIFRNGTASSESVSFDQSAENLKKFGLDSPDYIITMVVAGESYTYKIKAKDESAADFYVAASTDKMIRIVPITSISFINNEEKDYYLGFMALEVISDISEFSLSGEVNASFTLKKNEEDEAGYIVMNGDKNVESQSFQDFYSLFLQTTAVDYNTVSVSKAPNLTITLKHHDGSAATVLRFYKLSESRYQYSVGGTPMGQISSSGYSKIVREATKLIA